jgi:hypothetical protein
MNESPLTIQIVPKKKKGGNPVNAPEMTTTLLQRPMTHSNDWWENVNMKISLFFQFRGYRILTQVLRSYQKRKVEDRRPPFSLASRDAKSGNAPIPSRDSSNQPKLTPPSSIIHSIQLHFHPNPRK